MTETHPNLDLLEQVDIQNIRHCAALFDPNVVWHFFNPMLPDLAGDYAGIDGIERFFAVMADQTAGTFSVAPRDARPVGEELVVIHTCNTMVLRDLPIEVDVVLFWRIVNGKIAEIWDIPAVHSARDAGSPD